MIATIFKGFHYSIGTPRGLYFNQKEISYEITFTDSCIYDLNSTDQLDTNKLFGIGYFPTHHYNSVRFGWRYNTENLQMEIMGYWYINQVRYYQPLRFVNINEPHEYTISITPDNHNLFIDSQNVLTIPLGGRSIGYKLSPYFGGNRRAPHKMKIIFK